MIRHFKGLLLAGLVLVCWFRCPAAETAASSAAQTVKSFQLRNEKYGELLRPKDANNANGTPLVLYSAQPWKCMTWKLHPAGEGQFQLQNHFTSKTFAPEVSGEKIQVRQVPFEKDAAARPTWKFTKLPDGTYQILDAKSGKALTAVPGGDGAREISVQPWHGGEEQKWRLEEIDPRRLTM